MPKGGRSKAYSISRMILVFFMLVFVATVLLSVYFFGSFAGILYETSQESFLVSAEKSASALKNDFAAVQMQQHQLVSSIGSSEFWNADNAYERMLYAQGIEESLSSVLGVFDSVEAILITQRSDNVMMQRHTMQEDAFLRLLDAYSGQRTTQPGQVSLFSESENGAASHLVLRESLSVFVPADLHLRTSIFLVFAVRLDTLIGEVQANETLCLCRKTDGMLRICSAQGAASASLPANLQLQETGVVSAHSFGGSEYMSAVFPLDAADMFLVCLKPRTPLLAESGPVLLRGIAIIGGVLLLSVVGIIVISKRIRQPIRKIMDDVNIISGGAYSHRLPVGDAKELAQLSDGMNALLDELSHRTQTLMETQRNLYEARILNRESEIMALQSQINPHFLYNTLECVQGIAQYYHVSEIAQIVSSMVGIYRYSAARPHIGTVDSELICAEKYAEIIRIRFEGRYKLVTEVDEAVRGCAMPKMILQPLLENAVNHGLAMRSGSGTMQIRCTQAVDQVCIQVRDDGAGISETRLAELRARLESGRQTEHGSGSSIGLSNIHQRLRMEFGEKCGLVVESTENAFTEIRFCLPLTMEAAGKTAEEQRV